MSVFDTDSSVLNNLVSSAPINPTLGKPDEIIAQALPAPLAAPTGWRSQIIYSNSAISTGNDLNLSNTNTSYDQYNTSNTYGGFNTNTTYGGYNTSNTYGGLNTSSSYDQYSTGNAYNTSGFNQSSTGYSNTSYGDNVIHQHKTVYTEEEKRNIINKIQSQYPPPLVVKKTLPNNSLTYKQSVSLRYLKPPTPPPPGPLIIREVRPPPPRPQSPIQIRQRPPPPPTPPPLVLRERPPQPPPSIPSKVVEKVLPPPPAPERRVIVERFGACPPKPKDVIIERWLPYQQTQKRRVLVERAAPPVVPVKEPNLLILHDSPHASVRKQFINQGVVRADPDDYIRRYGSQLNSWHSSREGHIVEEATRAVPPPVTSTVGHHYHDESYSTSRVLTPVGRAVSPVITRVASPIPRSSSYHYGSTHYDTPYYSSGSYYDVSDDYYCGQSRYRYRRDPYCYDNDYLTMTDVTPSWRSYCRSSSYDPYYYRSSSYYDPYYRSSSYCDSYDRYSSYHSPRTIRVRSAGELHNVLCDLTDGHVPPPLDIY